MAKSPVNTMVSIVGSAAHAGETAAMLTPSDIDDRFAKKIVQIPKAVMKNLVTEISFELNQRRR
jgi:hypothetical protein